MSTLGERCSPTEADALATAWGPDGAWARLYQLVHAQGAAVEPIGDDGLWGLRVVGVAPGWALPTLAKIARVAPRLQALGYDVREGSARVPTPAAFAALHAQHVGEAYGFRPRPVAVSSDETDLGGWLRHCLRGELAVPVPTEAVLQASGNERHAEQARSWARLLDASLRELADRLVLYHQLPRAFLEEAGQRLSAALGEDPSEEALGPAARFYRDDLYAVSTRLWQHSPGNDFAAGFRRIEPSLGRVLETRLGEVAARRRAVAPPRARTPLPSTPSKLWNALTPPPTARWEPLLSRAVDPLELASVRLDVRAAALVLLPDAAGFEAARREFPGSVEIDRPRASRAEDAALFLPADGPNDPRHVLLSRAPLRDDPALLVRAWAGRDGQLPRGLDAPDAHVLFGRILGYPECCLTAFSAQRRGVTAPRRHPRPTSDDAAPSAAPPRGGLWGWLRGRLRGRAPTPAATGDAPPTGPAEPQPASFQNLPIFRHTRGASVGPYPPLLNHFLRDSWRLFSHYPCRYDCPASLALAQRMVDALEGGGIDARDALREALSGLVVVFENDDYLLLDCEAPTTRDGALHAAVRSVKRAALTRPDRAAVLAERRDAPFALTVRADAVVLAFASGERREIRLGPGEECLPVWFADAPTAAR